MSAFGVDLFALATAEIQTYIVFEKCSSPSSAVGNPDSQEGIQY